jgi:hypothetical protein
VVGHGFGGYVLPLFLPHLMSLVSRVLWFGLVLAEVVVAFRKEVEEVLACFKAEFL